MCFCEIHPYKSISTHTHTLQEMINKANSSECRCEMQTLWFSLQCFSWRLALWMNRSVCFWLRLEPVSSFSPLVALRNDFLLLKNWPSSPVRDHALVQVLEVDDVLPRLPSSSHLSRLRLRAFMKKLLTVFSSRPSCCEMVSCISLDGRLFSLKMARSVRRCRSVKTSRDFFGVLLLSLLGSSSFLLHASGVSFVRKETQKTEKKHVRINHTYIHAFSKHLNI